MMIVVTLSFCQEISIYLPVITITLDVISSITVKDTSDNKLSR